MEAGYLPAKFGADGAGRAGDHNHLAFKGGADLVLFQPYRLAAQQIFDGDIADLPRQPALLNYVPKPWYGLALHTTRVTLLQNPGHLSTGSRRDCDENDVDLVLR